MPTQSREDFRKCLILKMYACRVSHANYRRQFCKPVKKVLVMSASFNLCFDHMLHFDACGLYMFRWIVVPHAAADLAQHEAG